MVDTNTKLPTRSLHRTHIVWLDVARLHAPQVHETIVRNALFKDGDVVAIGASGGKGKRVLCSELMPKLYTTCCAALTLTRVGLVGRSPALHWLQHHFSFISEALILFHRLSPAPSYLRFNFHRLDSVGICAAASQQQV